ncbi:serine/threonine protein kinase [Nocardia sp. NBC_00565]|uniref:serine/threonine-protein kinase n=1 Tax=Nocardia sp. NBC_00565 TaxID=2975993 RepID=UPI002E803D15|nr:serine/threonine-protein kinase [Nocardia sp. NBC_00565]WUC05031.1 serine/threonine protein kinase [Nocardia sp. NBC_00565]
MRPLDPDDPARIGDYRLLGLLGAGGMGRVYLGRSAGGRTVAVKVIRPDLIGGEFRERFRREVAAARRVGGKFTAQVLDADVDSTPPWLATGYVAGFSLTDAVEQFSTFSENTLLVLAHGLAEALIAVHGAGIVHRDLKPSNVLLAVDGPKVIDFGIARAAEDSALTTTGNVIGSPGFMCPEQVVGPAMGPEGDVFALGGVLVYAATGQGPFGSGETVQMLYRVVYEEPRLNAVPERLRPLIAACLNKDVAARPTPQQVLEQLAELGVPERGGWLPAPVLEEVSRRAVALLDLESVEMPQVGFGQPARDPSRYAPTVSQPVPQPNSGPYPRAGQTPGQHGSPDTVAWQSGNPMSRANPSGVYAPYPPAHDRSEPRLAYPAQPSVDYYGQQAPPPKGSRRTALIIAAVLACVVVAVVAFVIGTQLNGKSSDSASTAESSTAATPATDETDTSTSTTSAPTSEAASGTEVPQAFVGTWTGTARDALATFDIELTILDGKIGAEIATSANTGQASHSRCERAERLTNVSDTEITFVARLSGGASGCMDEGSTSTVKLQPDGSVAYSFTGGFSGVLGNITGTLHKS